MPSRYHLLALSRVTRFATALLLVAFIPMLRLRGAEAEPAPLKTFSEMGKEVELLQEGKEVEIFHHAGQGCLTHTWFAMDERSRIRIYVDGEAQPSIDMALDLGHGYAFGGPKEPWGNARLGRYGGEFNNYQIPFGRGIRVTVLPVTKVFDRGTGRKAWWIIRGTENLPLLVGGRLLPRAARLRLHRLEDHVAEPFEEFNLCNVPGAGLLSQVTMAAQCEQPSSDPRDLTFMEGCMRAYPDGATVPMFLSSGLEDYFLGAGYFHRNQLYFGPVAGLTHLDKTINAFSAYRFHDEDPVFFKKGLRLTCRCGEKIGEKVFTGNPPRTRYSTYVWLYQW